MSGSAYRWRLNILINDTDGEIGRDFTGAADVNVSATSIISATAESMASAAGQSSEQADGSGGTTDSKNSDEETAGQTDYAQDKGGTTAEPTQTSASTQSTGNSSSESESGESSSSGGVSVAATIAVNYVEVHNNATIRNGVTIIGTGDVVVEAISLTDAIAQGIATSTNTDSDTGVAAAVALNIALVDSAATVGNSVTLTGNSIAVRAITPTGEKNIYQARALAGAASSGTAVGGSISVNYIDTDASATVGNNATLTATGGDIDVAASSLNEIQNLAGGAAISTEGGTGVGVAVALNIVNELTITASVGNNATLSATSGSVSVTATSSFVPKIEDLPLLGEIGLTSFAAGIAGSTGGTVIGGSSSVNVIFMRTKATIGDNATIIAGQNVTVEAIDTFHLISAAGGLAASTGGSGVGIGIDVGVITRTAEASVGSGTDVTATSGDILVNASSDDQVTSIAASFGLAGGNVGLAGSISVQVLNASTRAFMKDTPTGLGGRMTAGGDVSVTANGDFEALMIAGALGASSSAGIGVASTTLVHIDTVEARIGNRNIVNSAGAVGVKVTATSTEDVLSITAAGAAASSVAIAVSPNINVLDETTLASVGRGTTVNAQNDTAPGVPDVVVTASDETDIISVAGSIAAAGSVGVGVGADVLSLTKNTQAYMDSGVTSQVDGDVDVTAHSEEDVTSVAVGIAVGGTAGVGINASVHVLGITTRAYIGDDPDEATASAGAGDVHAGGTVRIAADDRTEMDKFVATVAVGGSAGVGAAATVTVVTKTTEAFIGAGASVTGDGNTAGLVAATGGFTPTFEAATAGSEGLEAGTAKDTDRNALRSSGEVGAPDVDAVDSDGDGADDQDPKLNGQRVLTAGNSTIRGVAVAATNQDDIETYSAAIGGGTVGVAVAAAVNVINTTTSAYIGNGAQVNVDQTDAASEQTVSVAAANDFHHVALAAGAGFGAVGVAPGVDVTVLSGNTTAAIGAGATVKAKDDVLVAASSSEDILLVGAGIAAGTVGVGGGVSVLTINNTTYASIAGNVSAGGDVVVSANDDSEVFVFAGALAGGVVGVGASVGVIVINKDTQAFVANGATVDAKAGGIANVGGVLDGTLTGGGAADGFDKDARSGLVVQAESSEEITHITVAAGVGFVGVSGAAEVTILNSDTQAWIGSAQINQTGANAGASGDQGVFVGAANEVRILSFAGAIAGGFVGVGGAVNVGVIKNDVNAQIRTGAVVTVEDDVEVNSLAIKDIDSFLISGAGGVVGVAGAVNVWSIGTTFNGNYSDTDENRNTGSTQNALERTMDERQFDASAAGVVDVDDDSIGLGGSYGLSDGDAVVYERDGGSNIGGLSAGTTYYVNVQADGRIQLYNSSANAIAGGSTGRVNLTSTGSGTEHRFEGSFTDTADADAARQGEGAAGKVSGDLTAFDDHVTAEERADGNNSSGERLAGITKSGSDSLAASAPSAADVTGDLAAVSPITGTAATIATGTQVTAGDAIRVRANEDLEFDVAMGGVAAGLVGVGISVGVTTIASNVSATAGGDLEAGGEVLVEAKLSR